MSLIDGPNSSEALNSQYFEFRSALANAKHIIVLAGAGLSAGSGIPTFRSGGGIWQSLDPLQLATPSAFAANPSLVWQFYHHRRVKALEAKTNRAHKVLAKLSIPGYLKVVAPSAKSFHLITQNVDRLSVRALEDLEKEVTQSPDISSTGKVSKDSIIEMHGRLFDVKCSACDYCEEDLSESLCPALGEAEAKLKGYQDAGTKPNDIPESKLPHCPKCGAIARPGVVFFDEKPYKLDEINKLVFKADMCLLVGTSATVYPASSYAYRIHRRGGKIAVFDPEPNNYDRFADFIFREKCEKAFEQVFPELK